MVSASVSVNSFSSKRYGWIRFLLISISISIGYNEHISIGIGIVYVKISISMYHYTNKIISSLDICLTFKFRFSLVTINKINSSLDILIHILSVTIKKMNSSWDIDLTLKIQINLSNYQLDIFFVRHSFDIQIQIQLS